MLEVRIEKGMTPGQKVRFSGDANEMPGMLTNYPLSFEAVLVE
jgi:hypothetical protein